MSSSSLRFMATSRFVRLPRKVGNFLLCVAVMCLATTIASPAAAVVLDLAGSTLNGNIVTDFSDDNELGFDIDFVNNDPVWLNVIVVSGDTDLPLINFNHIGVNATDRGWTDYHFELEEGEAPNFLIGSAAAAGASAAAPPTFLDPGLVFANGGGTSRINEPSRSWIFFDNLETTGVSIFGGIIDVGALGVGGSFMIHVAPSIGVPEPATFIPMLLAACCLLTMLSRRMRR